MTISALLFGSIGTLAETSDIQRRAYNRALAESTLAWEWDPDTYRRLLAVSGGKERLRLLADATGTELGGDEIDSIHAAKTRYACDEVRASQVPLRPGVAATVALARSKGLRLGLVTTTYRANIDAISDAAGDALRLDDFDVVIDRSQVVDTKPAPDAYLEALRRLGIGADEALAIEDTAVSTLSAAGAGLTVITTAGSFTSGQHVVGAELQVPSLGTDRSVDPAVAALIEA